MKGWMKVLELGLRAVAIGYNFSILFRIGALG